jgi:hypothetical protein
VEWERQWLAANGIGAAMTGRVRAGQTPPQMHLEPAQAVGELGCADAR